MDNHAEKEVGDYIISLASEEAEGTYRLQNGELKWNVPEEGFNTHLEIVVRDNKDKCFIPELKIKGKVYDEGGKFVVEKDFPFLWHPFLFHYGAFFKIPEAGKYRVELEIPAPEFHRHDEIKGKRYEKDVKVKMQIEMESGREPHGPE
ncbi:iron transporter [Zunongwangia sp. F260]|uniref:Iron transporter n=1 Tax=Autumnicola lenta TaxID=3075593 RepID=A0ABU3CH95_9FLAO|nr:iron transporter [Zunongwangia sp. F260]MDT0645722.1 iron transporter [Zunongwangia sp. F260]